MIDLGRLRALVAHDAEAFPPSRAELRLSRALVLVATAWLALVVSWELFGPILAGHYASSASTGIIAENMRRWGIVAPVWSYTRAAPDPSLYYCHHPWGIFWTTAGFQAVLGRHDFVCRLPAALLSVATPAIVYALGRDLYRPLSGALGAAAFAVLPITLSFAAFNALEVPVIAYGALFLWAWLRAKRGHGRRWTALAALAAALAMLSDWPGSLLVFVALAVEAAAFARAPRAFGPARLWLWVALAALGLAIGLGFLATFSHYDKLGDLFGSYRLRSHADRATFAERLDARRHWIELMFTPLAIGAGKAAVALLALRAWALRRTEELLPAFVLVMAVTQYVAFPQGADVHVFWPHHFALYFALAIACITALLYPPLAERWGAGRGLAATALLVLAPLTLVLRDGVETLVWARRTGGRFSEKGLFIQTDGDKIAALRSLAGELPPGATIALHGSMAPTWAQVWALGGRPVTAPVELSDEVLRGHDVWVADLRGLRELEAARLLAGSEVRAYGPFLVGRQGFGFEARSLTPSEPDLTTRWLQSGTEPVWTIARDEYLAWELGLHHGLEVAAPSLPPRGLEQLRVAHNVALEQGDASLAERLAGELLPAFGAPRVELEGGLVLEGVRVEEGVQPRATLLFRAAGPLRAGVLPKVRSRVVERALLSTTLPDPHRRDVAPRPLIAPRLWRRGHLYSLSMALLPRPGVESFELTFAGVGAPRPKQGPPVFELLRY